MTNFKTKLITLLNPTVLGFIITGYILLASIIIFREEINIALDYMNTPALASVEINPLVTIPPSMPVPRTVEPQVTYNEYVQEILNNPNNFQKPERLLHGRAYLEGKQTSFLIGF